MKGQRPFLHAIPFFDIAMALALKPGRRIDVEVERQVRRQAAGGIVSQRTQGCKCLAVAIALIGQRTIGIAITEDNLPGSERRVE